MITKQEVVNIIEQFNKDYRLAEETLKNLFEMENSQEIIMARVLALDRLYSTGLKNYEPDEDKKQVVWAEKMALHIYKYNDKILSFVKSARESDGGQRNKFADDAIKAIMRVSFETSDCIETDKKQYNLVYSFATKYCSFIEPSIFAIYDSKVIRFLTRDIKRYFDVDNKVDHYTLCADTLKELEDHEGYQNLLLAMNELLNNDKVGILFDQAPRMKELDKFIWQLEKNKEER